MTEDAIFGAVEAGGTKMVCGVGSAAGGSRETARIDTRDPAITIREIVAFFEGARERHGSIAAIGIASFGPLDLDRASPDFGAFTTTPKKGWPGANLPRALSDALDVPTAVDTDVNAAALAEARQGAAKGKRAVAYVTIGTGVGVGLVNDGHTIVGLGHPEGGHLLVRRHPAHDGFAGICPYHGDCLEGLASGPAIHAAWNETLQTLPHDHAGWAAQADYLGQLCASLVLLAAPEHIILGGGVMGQDRLFPLIRAETLRRLAGYAALWTDAEADARITPPGCSEAPGLVGAYLLAEAAVDAPTASA